MPTATSCPSCGMPVVIASAALPVSAQPEPSSGGSSRPVTIAEILAPQSRSAAVAGLLECVMPGAGLLHAGRLRTGIVVLIGTMLVTILAVIGLQWYDGFYRWPLRLTFVPAPPTPAPSFSTFSTIFWALFGLELLWLLLRIIWAGRAAVRQVL